MLTIEGFESYLDEIITTVPDEVIEALDTSYLFEGRKVPRVTKIISKCIHDEGLMQWANFIGFRHQSYTKTLNHAADVGTQCHTQIHGFFVPEVAPLQNVMEEARFAFESFNRWYLEISSAAEVIPIYHEKAMVCKYFGGTMDALYSINGKNFIVDYKTSNHLRFNYALQIAAYMYMLEKNEHIPINGCILLQLSKTSVDYNEFALDFSNPDHAAYMDNTKISFMALVLWYYEMCCVEHGFNQFRRR